ncbi:uncharacterized protein PHALS_08177 [Plasmopara halstedii]|uniref:Uncharacterized protein n=1 Tax=Plasmopara halstedii TaxID=4781 RepID=A0A0P1ABD0_PLAHL|nr:uncharacterized protein PHALS_08177 [Plasmopara halstedii]CEG38082.1 hypothetical protein PHALS_08177 [Plasmopara halstedii]|eukprot:XP_024574451.1 hypothetical protein PHALS_08177 [Plasmopara halstedii]
MLRSGGLELLETLCAEEAVELKLVAVNVAYRKFRCCFHHSTRSASLYDCHDYIMLYSPIID